MNGVNYLSNHFIFIISLSYYLTLNHYMAVTVGNFTSIFGMFAAILFMYYYLLYKSPEYNQRKRFKHFIHITNLIIIAFSTFVLVHLALKLFFSIEFPSMKKQSSNLNFALICHAFIIFKIASMPVLQTCSNNFSSSN